jgi:protein MpaA
MGLGTLTPGRSVEGRSLVAYSLGAAEERPLALVFGGIHGDELDTPRAVAALASALREAPAGAHVILVEAVNPDGLAAGTKDNARGVDLNRNFPSANWNSVHPPGYASGIAPLSEPESAWLAMLIERFEPRRLVAVHQPFRCVNFDGPARDLAERMARACGWPAVEDIGYPTPGSFGSCYGVDRGLPVITLELPRPLDEEDLGRAVAALQVACRP